MPANRLCVAICSTLLVMMLSACGSSSDASAKSVDSSYSPQKSLADAVDAVLTAEQQGDASKSFSLLDPTARTTYKDVTDWTARLRELPAITAFKLDDAKSSTQVVTVDHQPGLDPFKGLSAAHEKQSWVGHKYANGWLLEADPQTDPILPPDSGASAAAKSWAEAVQACDKDRAHALQAIDTLIATTTPSLCNVKGDVAVSSPGPLTEGPDSSDIVAQYSTDALVWAKTVSVNGPASFHVVLAPIGNDWKVLALY